MINIAKITAPVAVYWAGMAMALENWGIAAACFALFFALSLIADIVEDR
jgi:hypothetical protein